MRITYLQLSHLISRMTKQQQNSDITVEISHDSECFPAELRICGENHDSLDDGHPVIFLNAKEDSKRFNDINTIAKEIGL